MWPSKAESQNIPDLDELSCRRCGIVSRGPSSFSACHVNMEITVAMCNRLSLGVLGDLRVPRVAEISPKGSKTPTFPVFASQRCLTLESGSHVGIRGLGRGPKCRRHCLGNRR